MSERVQDSDNPQSQQIIFGRDIAIDSLQKSVEVAPVDDFMTPSVELLKYQGINQNFKRNAKRKLEKAGQVGASPTAYYPPINGISGDDAESKQVILLQYGYGLFDVVEPPYNLISLGKTYEVSAANYAAINAKVTNIVGLGYELVPSLKVKQMLEDLSDSPDKLNKTRKKLERAKEEILSWLDTRNDNETFTETLTKVYLDYATTGNGYLEVGRKTTGEIGYIGHIPSATMRVRRLRDGFIQIVGGKFTFFKNFHDDDDVQSPIGTDPRPNEIIHLADYTPTNSYYGVPAIVPAKNAMAGNEFASKFNLEYFENKATPRYIFWIKGAKLSRDAESKLFEFFQNNLRGQSHRTLIVPLPGDEAGSKVEVKMEAVENGIQDGSFDKYRKSNLQEILMAHRVPMTKVGAGEGLSLAAAKEADKSFKEQVTRPAQDALEKRITAIISEKTDMFRFNFNELTLTDEDTQSKIDERYLRMQVILPNEVRSRMGMSGIPGGDEPVKLTGQQAAEQTAQASGNRLRDQERQNNQADEGQTGARNAQGEGRQQP
jgi:PBSX family phage portal protein